MLKRLLNKLGNTILFYHDKNGNSVFKNFCIFKNDGNLYTLNLTKQQVGKILEYRFKLDKVLKRMIFATIIFVYIVFIKLNPTLINILGAEFTTIFLVFCYKLFCQYLYSRKLQKTYGPYTLIDFNPNTSPEQQTGFRNNVYFNILACIFCLIIFFLPALILDFSIKKYTESKKPKYQTILTTIGIYHSIYPPNTDLLDLSALANFKTQNYKDSIKDYIKIFELCGKNFTDKDILRFSNILYLEKEIDGPASAIDIFNEYLTKKRLSSFDSIKMLWIKSIFKIENHRYDTVLSDYQELEQLISEKDKKNKFYLNCDKTYMLYLMGEYPRAIKEYDKLIKFAKENKKEYKKELSILYAERGFSKWRVGDINGRNSDFVSSGINLEKINLMNRLTKL